MCDPATAVIIAGTAYSIYSKMQAGDEAKAQAERTARILEASARTAESAGAAAAGQKLAKGAVVAGAAKVVMGASGTDIDTSVLVQTNFMAQWEASYVRASARLEAWGLRERAVTARMEGEAAQDASRYDALASIIGGAGALYGKGGGEGASTSSSYSTGSSFTPGENSSEYSYSSIGKIGA